METKEFQSHLVEDIKRELAGKDIPLERVQELAKAALELEDKYPDGIPAAEAKRLLGDYGDIAQNTKKQYDKVLQEAEQEEIDRIRRSLGIEGKDKGGE